MIKKTKAKTEPTRATTEPKELGNSTAAHPRDVQPTALTLSALEELLGGRRKLTPDEKTKLLDQINVLRLGPLNTPQAAEALRGIADGTFLCFGGNWADFYQRALGWPANEGERIFKLYAEKRWAEVAVPQYFNKVSGENGHSPNQEQEVPKPTKIASQPKPPARQKSKQSTDDHRSQGEGDESATSKIPAPMAIPNQVTPRGTAPDSQFCSSRNEKKRPSTPASDNKEEPGKEGGEITNTDANATSPTSVAPASSGETPAISVYEDHPLAAIFPLMSKEELQELAEDIRQNGLREAIVRFDGKILDGRNRDRACRLTGTKAFYEDFKGHDPAAFVLSKNIHRRNLTKSQKAAIAADLLPMIEAEARRRKMTAGESARDDSGQFAREPGVEKTPPAEENNPHDLQTAEQAETKKSRDIAAKALDVNPHYVSDAKMIKEEAPDLHEKVKQGTLSMSQAKRELAKRKPKEVEAQPFTVILWDESGEAVPMPTILKDKKMRETLACAVIFHLTRQPKCALGCESKGGFRDAALFVLSDAPELTNQHDGLILQKQSCLFLVVRTIGDVPKPKTVPSVIIEGGAVEARIMIEKMWPKAPRLISDGHETLPEGWRIG